METANQIQDGRHDFDFYVGAWKIHNRRLKELFVNSDDWYEFEGITVARKALGGLGNIDEVVLKMKTREVLGLTVRIFNPESKEWSLYWSDNVRCTLGDPMIGQFDNGIGVFYSHEKHNNKSHIFSRFIWSGISETTCKWEQAFSSDGGKTWETNWTMDMIKQL